MIRQQASQAWLWQNEVLSDMRLQLCTVQPAPDLDQQGPASTAAEDGSVLDTADAQAASRGAKVARRNDGSATAPELASAAQAEAAALAAALEAAAAVVAPAAAAAATVAASGASIRTPTFCLHANIMASSSAYFKKRITESASGSGGGALSYADSGVGVDAAGGGLLLVERVEEGELTAMEAMLRHCYTYQLCADGGDVSQLSVTLLLQMLALSDRFDVALCAQHCCEELAGRGAAQYTVEAINTILGGLPPGVRACAAFPAVEAAATERLLQVLGDVDALHERACVDDASLADQLRRLSLPSLLALLGSDRLTALSENSVVVTASDWMFRAPAAAACGAAELRQVAATLRLSRVSSTYLLEVLPRLEWLKVSPAERESLLAYVAAGAGVEAGIGRLPEANVGRQRQAALLAAGLLSGPPAWYGAPPRQSRLALPGAAATADRLVVRWEMPSKELKLLLQEAGSKGKATANSSDHFFHGFCFQMYVWVDGGPEEWQVRLGVACQGPMATWVDLRSSQAEEVGIDPRMINCRTMYVEASVGVLLAEEEEEEGVEEAAFWVGQCGAVNLFSPLPLVPRSPQALDPASWAPYLRDGKLRLGCTVHCCE